MGRDIKVSILLPALNVHEYIFECLNSVVRQSLKDIEVICIDAGSTDGTLDIIKEFMQKDDRIILIQSEKKSYGYQLNQGIIHSHGEYIGFVDTDDYIKNDMYEELYDCAFHNDADVVKSDFYVFCGSDDNRIWQKISHGDVGGIYGGAFSTNDYSSGKQTTDTFIWNAIYRRSYLNENEIRFNESPGAAYQDCGFRYLVFASVRRLYYLDGAYYCYRRDNSKSSMFSNNAFLYNIDECTYIVNRLLKSNIDKALRLFLSKKIITTVSNSYIECLFNGLNKNQLDRQLMEVEQWMRDLMEDGSIVVEKEDMKFEFINNMEEFTDQCTKEAERKRNNYREYFKQIDGCKRCFVFGAGKHGKAAFLLMNRNHLVSDIMICDNDSSKWGHFIYSKEIISPDAAIELYNPNTDCFVVASGNYVSDIYKELCCKGISEERIVVYSLDTNPMICTSDLHMIFGEEIN